MNGSVVRRVTVSVLVAVLLLAFVIKGSSANDVRQPEVGLVDNDY